MVTQPHTQPSHGRNPLLTIIGALARSLVLLVTGRVRFSHAAVGRTLTMEDGQEFTVFRHVKVKGAGEPAAAFVVRFTPAHMSVRQNIRFSLLPMVPLLGMHGFREKYWCVNKQTGMCQGIYAWQTRADAEAYARSVALRFMTRRSLHGYVSCRVIDQSSKPYWVFDEAEGALSRLRGVALLLILGLAAPAGEHLYWLAGGTWGLHTSTGARFDHSTTGVRVLAAVVIALLVAAALVVLARVGMWQQPAFVSQRVIQVFAWALAGVFLLETLANFTYNREYEWWMYGPVALVIALLALAVAGSGDAWPHLHWPHRTLPSR